MTADSLRPRDEEMTFGLLAVSRKPMADVLGEVYEQFLGKVIRLAAGHQARVEEKPKGLVPVRAFDGPSAPCRLSAMQCEPRPALTEVELFTIPGIRPKEASWQTTTPP